MSWKRIGLLVAGAVAVGLIARRRRPPSSKYFIHKTVLITGGSRGLGLVLARKIGQAGARVIICARNAQQLEQARVDLQRRDINASAFECDVTDQVAVQKMMSQIEARWGTLDLVVNNAGWIQVGPFDSLTEDDFEVAMRTHFWGPLYVMLEVLPGMRKRGSGQIVNITSIGGKISVPHLLAYNSSKFALVGLSQGIAAEVAQDGVQVTTVCPGLMRTGSPRNAVFKGDHRAEYAWFSIADSIPGLSMEAERAGDQILSAIASGAKVAILGVPAKIAALMHDMFPDLAIRGLALANRLLPRFGGIGQAKARGADSQSFWSPSILTRLTEQAAIRNNEVET